MTILATAYRRSVAPLLLAALIAPRLDAQGSEIVRGRVLDLVQQPLRDVQVVVTSNGSGSSATAKTDAKGVFTVVFHERSSTYTLKFTKVGFQAFAETITPTGIPGVVQVADVALSGAAQVLQPLTTSAARPRAVIPIQGGGVPPPTGGSLDADGAGRFLSDPGDLNARAGQLAGVFNRGDSGYSVLGARPDQNKVIVDGADFGSSSLPRDAIGSASLVINSADPANGQFAGGETVITTRAGGEAFAARLRSQIIDPHLAWGDPDAPTPVPRTIAASGFVSRPLIPKRVFAFLAFDASERTTVTPSLLAPRTSLLSQLGVSPDSIARLLGALGTLGVPTTAAGLPDNGVRDLANASLRVDYRIDQVTSFTLSALGNWSRFTGSGVSELALPTVASQSRSGSVRYQFVGSTFWFPYQLLEALHINVVPSSSHAGPYSSTPGANVLVGTFVGGDEGLTAFRFGGGSGAQTDRTGSTFDLENEISFTATNLSHQVKFTQEVRHDHATVSQLPGAGAFTFQSLSDLAANAPSSYSRALGATGYNAQATTVAFSLGDIWRPLRGKLEFQGGVRFDERTSGPAPAYNPVVDSLFGARTDHVPVDQEISPRLGFSWHPGKADRGMPIGYLTRLPRGGYATRGWLTPTFADGIALAAPGSSLIISGNFGAYRNLISPTRVASLGSMTGLPGTTQYLSCVGSATPVPDWSASATPTQCADGSGASGFAATQPRVTVFDPAFHAPVSWRGNLEASGVRVAGWGIGPSVSYSVGANVESDVNLNLRRTAAFALASEGNRPVYAPASAIVPGTGLFAPGAAQITPSLGPVTQIRSDLGYRAAQFTVAIIPPAAFLKVAPIFLTYSLNVQRATERGFNGTTAGDPFAEESVAGQQPMHQITIATDDLHLWWFAAAVRLSFLSGVPYTPVVANDINGDGLANDRAFVANPASTPDTALASQMNALLASAPSRARDCLISQRGTIAGANSCRTPWRAQLDLNLDFSPPNTFALGDRFRITTHLLNASGALVRLFGLENTPLGQSAASSNVDSRLLYVTGFDPTTNQFSYRVNQLFGEPVDYGSTRHLYPPFELQLGVEYRFGYPSTVKAARELPFLPGITDKDVIASRVRDEVVRGLGRNPLDTIVALADSLGLTAEQRAAVTGMARRFDVGADSLIAPILAFAVAHPKSVTRDELFRRYLPLGPAWRALRGDAWARGIVFLLPAQRAQLVQRGVRAP